MRYLVNTETGKTTEVSDTDDKKFYELLEKRRKDGRQQYVQTGAHDPRVSQIEMPGQDPANGDQEKRISAQFPAAEPASS